MKHKIKELYKTIQQKYPALGNFLWRLRSQKPLNTVRYRIVGKNNVINSNGSILSSVEFDIQGNNNSIEIKRSCMLESVRFYIRGNNHRVFIGEGCKFVRGGNIWFEDSFGMLKIGDETAFQNVHIAVTEPHSQVFIGKDCLFAYDIDIRTGDSHSIIDANSKERINYAENIYIGNHVWVAAHCNILKGATIPDNSIVATGSVVTKKFLETEVIIAGNPAKVIKEGVNWKRERIYKSNE